jgi:hypothetical protein
VIPGGCRLSDQDRAQAAHVVHDTGLLLVDDAYIVEALSTTPT